MQWRKNRVAIGVLVFGALLAFTIWATTTRDRPNADAAVEVPTVDVDKDSLTELEITRPGADGPEEVVLSRVGDEWRVTSPVDDDADRNNVEAALNRLADLKPLKVAATRPENYGRLEVDDAQAVRVVAKGADGTPPVELRIGKYANGVTMVRIGDLPEVFTLKGSARHPFDRDLKVWRDRRVTNAKASDVERITFKSDNGRFGFSRQDGAWVPDDKLRGVKEFDPKQVEGLLSTAARLTASGFAPEEVSIARAGLNEPTATVAFEVSSKAPEAEGEADVGVAESEMVELAIGDETGNARSEFYLQRAGDSTIYVISSYLADRLQPEASAFEKPEAPPAPAVPPQQGGIGQPGMPPNQQLPPEVMEQLRRQIEQQQR
ncbi:MAG: DUF4340 domain-containing protein [Myxococcota bacterium]